MLGESAESAFESAEKLFEKYRFQTTEDILNYANILAYLEIRMSIEKIIPYTKPDGIR
jgi:hypothetical protein